MRDFRRFGVSAGIQLWVETQKQGKVINDLDLRPVMGAR